MNLIKNNYGELIYESTLDNGMNVYIVHKPEFVSSYAMIATPFGAFDLEQVDASGVHYHFQPGSAHFLEHKLFEDENRDVLSMFADMGASANAGTSYESTSYYFSHSGSIEKPLSLLLDFVQSLSISDASVEKEKGIIIQELSMYDQMPDFRLYMETLKSIYHNHPLKYDIGGSAQSVRDTTREELECAYSLNYHPANMILVVVTQEDPAAVLSFIEQNQLSKTFPADPKIKRVLQDEPATVVRKDYTFTMRAETEKYFIGYKLPAYTGDDLERLRIESMLFFILESNFSTLNPQYQDWLDQGIISDYFSYEINYGKDQAMLLFANEGNNSDALAQLIESILAHPVVDEDKLEQLKRRYMGSTIRMFTNYDRYAQQLIQSRFKGTQLFELIEGIHSIRIEELEEAKKEFVLTNRTITKVKISN